MTPATDRTFRAWALPGKDPQRTRRLIEAVARLYGQHPMMRAIVVQHVLRPAGVTPGDSDGAARAIHAYVRDHIDFWPEAGEQVLTPARVLIWRFGDCDDRTGLVAAMLEAVRIRWRLEMAFLPGGHIWPEAFVAGRWVPLETSDPRAQWAEHPADLVRRVGDARF